MKATFQSLIALAILLCQQSVTAQSFELQLSKDTVLAGNSVQVTFMAQNINGNIEYPDLSEFQVYSGPNISSSMSMIQGEVTQKATYSFLVKFDDIGAFTIPPAYFVTGEEAYETAPKEIIVLPNPDGIIDEPVQERSFFWGSPFSQERQPRQEPKPKKTKKKKRKLKKI